MLDHNLLKCVLDYSPETGVFTWRQRASNRIKIGDIAGRASSIGYILVGLRGKRYWAHRLAWFYVHGSWPSQTIDHIDGNKLNNCISNLRLATMPQNIANSKRSKRNTSGYKGVSYDRERGLWRANIKAAGHHKQLGRFSTPEEAHVAYMEAARKYYGEFARAA